MSSILDKSLDELAKQGKDSPRKGNGRPRGGAAGGARSFSGSGNRSAPYAKRAPRDDPDADTWKHDLFNTNKLNYDDDVAAAATGSSASRTDEGPRSTRLKVTNLHYEVSEQELRALFEQIGPLAAPAGGRETSNPAIKYDISGRSQGEASVTYESEADAARAKEVFNNALAKGERISIAYDFSMPRRPRRNEDDLAFKSIPKTGLSGAGNPLLSRVQPASSNASRDNLRSPPARNQRDSQFGRDTNTTRGRGGPREVRGGRGSAVRGRGNGRPGKDRATKTVEDLDRELEEFMASGSSKEEAAPVVQNAEDIDMA